MSNNIGVFAGSFCPITVGHINAIARASAIVDKLYVVIGVNVNKHCAINLHDRFELVQKACNDFSNIEVAICQELITDFCREVGANIMFKSVRNAVELQEVIDLADYNESVWQGETVFLIADKQYRHISSSLIRELVAFQQDVSEYVPVGMSEIITKLLSVRK